MRCLRSSDFIPARGVPLACVVMLLGDLLVPACHWIKPPIQPLPLPGPLQPEPLQASLNRYCPEHQVPPPTMQVQTPQDTWNLLLTYHDDFWQQIQTCPQGKVMQERRAQILQSAKQGPWRTLHEDLTNVFLIGDANQSQWVIKPNRWDDLSKPLQKMTQQQEPIEIYPATQWQSIPAGTAILRDLAAEIISVGLGFDDIRPASIPIVLEIPQQLDGDKAILQQELCSAQAYVPQSFTLESLLQYGEHQHLPRDTLLPIVEQHLPMDQREHLIVFLAIIIDRDQDYHNLLLRSVLPGGLEGWFQAYQQQTLAAPSLVLSIIDNGACMPEMKPEPTPTTYSNITWLQQTLSQPISHQLRQQFSHWQHNGMIYKTKRLLETLPLMPGEISTAPKGFLQRAQCFMLEGQRKASRYADLLDACVPNLMIDLHAKPHLPSLSSHHSSSER